MANVLWMTTNNTLDDHITMLDKKIKQNLNNELETLDKIFIDIKKISGVKFYKKNIPIHLVISSHNCNDILGWFSIMRNRSDLVLECSCPDKKKTNFLILVLAHELFHLSIRKNQELKAQIEKLSKQNGIRLERLSKNMSLAMVLEELLISSFAPEGFFASCYFGSKIKSIRHFKEKNKIINFISARRFCAYNLKKLAEDYAINEKVIDEKYLLFLIDKIK